MRLCEFFCNKFAKFRFKEITDIKTADQLDMPTPDFETKTMVSCPTEIQKKLVKSLLERAAKVHSGIVDAGEDNMLKITSDGRKIGLDVRLINPFFLDEQIAYIHNANTETENVYRLSENNLKNY